MSQMARTPLGSPSTRSLRASWLVRDRYVTDGRRLLRVVDAEVGRAFASLEDCLTLEVRPYSPGELIKMRLRPVVPG